MKKINKFWWRSIFFITLQLTNASSITFHLHKQVVNQMTIFTYYLVSAKILVYLHGCKRKDYRIHRVLAKFHRRLWRNLCTFSRKILDNQVLKVLYGSHQRCNSFALLIVAMKKEKKIVKIHKIYKNIIYQFLWITEISKSKSDTKCHKNDHQLHYYLLLQFLRRRKYTGQ